MKIKILSFFILSISVCAFAHGAQQNTQGLPQPLINRQQETVQEKEKELPEKELKALREAQEKREKEQKKEEVRFLKKQRAEQRKQELKKAKEDALLEKIQKKQEKLRAKEESEKLKLQKKEEALARKSGESQSFLVLDYDLKFLASFYSNINYTADEAESAHIYRQYLGINIIGKFDDRIEMSGKFASRGAAGKYYGVFDMPYSGNDFSFFLESAYLNFRSEPFSDISYIFTVGKQYFTAGDGLIIDANQNGFLGARARADLTDLFSVDAFAGKADNKDFNVYGGSLKIKAAPVIEVGVYQEVNDTGFAYRKGVFTDSDTYAIESDRKTFYDIRLTGGNYKYKYRLEAAHQTGELVKSSSAAVEYDAFAFAAEGSWKGKLFKRESNAKILFSYADAKGDNVFNPTFSRRYDGLRRTGYGALFAAGTSDSFLELPESYKGINTIGAEFDIMPWNFLKTGLSFYLYSASDASSDVGDAGFAKLYGAKADLGNELDFFVKYKYLDYFDAGLGFAMYTPPSGAEKVFANTEVSYLYQIEVNAKF